MGLVSHRDILDFLARSFAGHGRDPRAGPPLFERTFVSHIMTRDPVTVTPSTPLRTAVPLLVKHRIGSLPVVEDEALVGMLTDLDLLWELEKRLTQ